MLGGAESTNPLFTPSFSYDAVIRKFLLRFVCEFVAQRIRIDDGLITDDGSFLKLTVVEKRRQNWGMIRGCGSRRLRSSKFWGVFQHLYGFGSYVPFQDFVPECDHIFFCEGNSAYFVRDRDYRLESVEDNMNSIIFPQSENTSKKTLLYVVINASVHHHTRVRHSCSLWKEKHGKN